MPISVTYHFDILIMSLRRGHHISRAVFRVCSFAQLAYVGADRVEVILVNDSIDDRATTGFLGAAHQLAQLLFARRLPPQLICDAGAIEKVVLSRCGVRRKQVTLRATRNKDRSANRRKSSPSELAHLAKGRWWAWFVSLFHHWVCAAVSISSLAKIVARPRRFELLTFAFGGQG